MEKMYYYGEEVLIISHIDDERSLVQFSVEAGCYHDEYGYEYDEVGKDIIVDRRVLTKEKVSHSEKAVEIISKAQIEASGIIKEANRKSLEIANEIARERRVLKKDIEAYALKYAGINELIDVVEGNVKFGVVTDSSSSLKIIDFENVQNEDAEFALSISYKKGVLRRIQKSSYYDGSGIQKNISLFDCKIKAELFLKESVIRFSSSISSERMVNETNLINLNDKYGFGIESLEKAKDDIRLNLVKKKEEQLRKVMDEAKRLETAISNNKLNL